jgi:hypothetical protein
MLEMKLQGVIPVVVLFAGTALGHAQIWSTDHTKQPAGKPAISLTVSVNPQQIKLGESTQLEVSLTNLSGGEIFVYKDIGDSDDWSYEVSAVDDKGVEAPTTPYYRYLKGGRLPGDPHYVPRSRHAVPVEPGKVLKSQINLAHLRLLDHTGTYTIWVERNDDISKSLVKSNAELARPEAGAKTHSLTSSYGHGIWVRTGRETAGCFSSSSHNN